jgi:predicted NAD-dependent protein-ADP-ribosyltransferase YbiA (DUF1768 family)
MASVLTDPNKPSSTMPAPPPSLTTDDVADLEFSARDAAYKRQQTDFTSTPATPEPDRLDEAIKKLATTGSVTEAIKTYSPPDAELPKMQPLTELQKRQRDIKQIREATRDADSIAIFELMRQDEDFDNQVAKDYTSMPANVFQQVYGPQVFDDMVALTVGASDVKARANRSRGVTEHLRDAGVQFIAGVPQLVGGLGSLAAKLNAYTPGGYLLDKGAEYFGYTEKGGPSVSDQMSVAIAGAGKTASDFVLQGESQTGHDLRRVDELRAQKDAIKQEADYAKNLRTDGYLLANLRDIGSSATNVGTRLLTDPSRATALIMESAPSFVAGGPATKVLTKAGKLALGVDALATTGARAKAVEALAFPTVVGGMEAGDAYSSTVNNIMNMSHEDLMVTSPEYKALIESGRTEAGAKAKLATEGGLTAAAIAFPVGAVTSSIARTKAFETAPLKSAGTLKQTVAQVPINVAKEVPEEAIQGGAGQFSQNVGAGQAATPDARLSKDVGSATVQGAVAGAGMPIGIGGTQIAVKGAGEAVKAPFVYTGSKLNKSYEAWKNKEAAKSPTSTESLTPVVAAAAEQAPKVGESLRTLAAESAPAVKTTETAPAVKTTETAPQVKPEVKPAEAATPDELAQRLRDHGFSDENINGLSPQQRVDALRIADETVAPVKTTETAPPITSTEPTESLTMEETAAPVPAAEIKDTETEDAPPSTPEENETFIKRVETAATLQGEDLEGLPTEVAQKVGELAGKLGRKPTRFEAMTELAKITEDPKADEHHKLAAAAFITNIINNNKDIFEGELPAFLENAAPDNPARQQFDEYRKVLQDMGENPQVKKAMDWLQKDAKAPDQDLTGVDLSSPEGQKAVSSAVSIATHAPHKANENVINQLLQADEGTQKLTPRQRQVLRGTVSTLAADRLFAANNRVPEPGMVEQEALDLEGELAATEAGDTEAIAKRRAQQAASRERVKASRQAATSATSATPAVPGSPTAATTAPDIGTPDITGAPTGPKVETPAVPASATEAPKVDNISMINRQINEEGGAAQHQKSIKQHVAEINSAIMSGNSKALKKGIKHLAMFAQTMRNKLAALQQSIDGKGDPKTGRVPYEAFDGKRMRPADGVFETYFNTKAANSVKFAQQLYAETLAITTLANDFANQHPDAGVVPSDDEIRLTLPEAPAQQVPGTPVTTAEGGSTIVQQGESRTPATTSETTPVKQSKPPSAPAPGQAPAATDTTAAEAKTRTPAEEGAQFTTEEVQDEKRFTQERLEKNIATLRDRVENETITPRNRATLKLLEDEAQRRAEKGKKASPESPETGSRTKQEPAPETKKSKGVRVLVTGGREFTDQAEADRVLDQIHKEQGISAIISGAARGADTLAANWARRNNVPLEEKPADWKTHGKSAGFRRNQEMLEEGKPDLVIAFPGGKGTAHMVNLANAAGVTLRQSTDVKTTAAPVVSAEEQARRKDQDEGAPEVGDTINIWAGTGENAELSNLALRPFTYEGREYQSVEHAYQSNKSGEFDQVTYDKYTGKENQKIVGKPAKTEESYNIRLMEDLMRASFEQNPDALKALKATGNLELTHNQDKGVWHTEFPRILTEIRDGETSPEPTEVPLDLLDTLEVEETPEQDIKAVFPKLVHQVKNWFHKAFKLPKQVKSRLTLLNNPLAELSNLLSSQKRLKEFMQDAELEGYQLDMNAIQGHQALLSLGNRGLKYLEGRLKAALAVTNKEGVSLLDQIKNGDPNSIRTRNNRILNLLEIDETGNKYNPQLIQSAMIAALDWALNIGDRQIPINVEDVARIMKIDEAEAIKYLDDFKHGMSRDLAVRTLADNIRKMWGLNTNRDTNEDFTKGIPEAVAKEMMMALQRMGLIKLGTIDYKLPQMVLNDRTGELELRDVTQKQFGRVWFDERDPKIQKLVENVDKTHNLFRDIALVEVEREGYSIGVPITDVDDTQLRQQMVRLTNQNKRAIFNGQHVPHFLDRIQLNLFQSMGLEGFVSLMSGRPYAEGDLLKSHTDMGYNRNDWESIKGRQRGLRATYRNIQKQVAAMEEFVRVHNLNNPDKPMTVEQVPVYYRHHVNRLGRPQMDGSSNPQTDKTARHTFVSTKATMDLSVPGSPQFQNFLRTIAQGLGVKTEKEEIDDVAAKVLKWIIEPLGEDGAGKFNAAFLALRDWLQTDQKDIPEATYKLLEDAKLSEHGLHALMAYARYDVSRETGQDLKKFEHWNPLEADGKTNGVINALMMAAGNITPKWLRTVAKGGVFFGRLNKTLNQHYKEDSADIYQTVADLTAVNMKIIGEAMASEKDPAIFEQFQTFRRLMALVMDDITFDEDGDLKIGRAIPKSPQTKSVYGAGPNSLAVSITNDLVSVIYERLSESIRTGTRAGELIYGKGGADQMMADLRALLSNSPGYNEEKNQWFLVTGQTELQKTAAEFTVTPRQFEVLKKNIRHFLVNPMVRGINSTVNEHVKDVTGKIQQATQIQSIFLRNMFISEVIASMAEKQANPEENDWHKGEVSLSENDMNRIRKLLMIFSPFIDTGTQRYMMSGGETTELFKKITVEVDGKPVVVNLPRGYSRTVIDNQLETAIYIYGSTYAGVRAIPTLNVGSGDGQMMMNMLADYPEEMKRMLHVFDGLYMPADKIQEYSRLVNESVYQTWTQNGNPIRAVADSYAAFMRASPVDRLFPGSVRSEHQLDALYEISKVAANQKNPEDKDILDSQRADTYMRGLVESLYDLADRLDARRQVYTEFALSIDQMASGEAPFVNKGSMDTAPGITMEELAVLMQERMDEILAKIQRKSARPHIPAAKPAPQATQATPQATAESPAPTAKDNKVEEFLRSNALYDEETGVQIVTVRQLRKLPGQDDLMQTAVENLAKDNYLLVFGNPSQVDRWERINRPERHVPGSNDTSSGKIDPIGRVITITNPAPSTVLHELIHGATIHKVTAYYSDPGSLTAADREAVARIEGLMKEWLIQDFSVEGTDIGAARTVAESAVVEHQQKADAAKARGDLAREAQHRGAAVNEFMAWVLSNQQLAEVAAKTNVQNPLFKIIGKALTALKTLIWGKGKGPSDKVTSKMLSQLRFNTQVLMATPTVLETMKAGAGRIMLYQSNAFGNNDRLTTVRNGFNQMILAWLNEPTVHTLPRGSNPLLRQLANQDQKDRRETEYHGLKLVADNMVHEFGLHFNDLNQLQAWGTFHMIQTALMTGLKINPNSMARLEELYDHVISKLNKEDFRTNQDPNDVVDDRKAQDKFDALHGLKAFHTDAYGRSSFLSSFLALSMASDDFRNVLSRMDKPEAEKNLSGGMDALLENTSSAILNNVSQRLSGEKPTSQNITDALDDLTAKMIEQVADQQKYIDVQADGALNAMDRAIAEGAQNLSATAIAKSNTAIATSGSRIVRAGARLVRAGATVVNEEAFGNAQQMLVEAANRLKGGHELRAFLNDWIGRHKGNANVWDMIFKVRALAQQTRQRYRDRLPKEIAKKFSRPLRAEEQTAMFRILGKADAMALAATQRADGTFSLATDTQGLNAEIRSLEGSIARYEGARATKVIQKAKQLATYMMTGAPGVNILKNAHAVARLFGEREYQQTLVNPQLVDDVDRLATLYALQQTSQTDRDLLQELVNTENDGLKFVFHYLVALRKNELAKVSGRLATPNYVKGYIPSIRQNQGSLIVANDADHLEVSKLGYAKLGPYHGSSADRTLRGKSYYFSPVSSRAPFRQGILQTVRYTSSGIDPNTGYLSDELTAGRITNQQVVDLVRRQIPRQRQTDENLMPVYDDTTGETIAYERGLDPNRTVGLDRSTHLTKMMGAWKGRQIEESFAPALNEELVDELKRTWDEGVSKGRQREFTNVMNSSDPVLADAVKLIPNYTRDYMKQVFGENTLMVRRDLELQALGDRQASIGDMFTGQTRWKPGVHERFEKLALGLFATRPFTRLLGDNQAYPTLVRAENLVEDFVTNAKTSIVIRSVVVPVANILANFGQLINRGVPVRTIISSFPKKVVEINTYIKARNQEIRLEAELEAAKGENKLADVRKLESRIQALKDSYTRLSIYPLIEGGQFASISQGQVTAEDLAIGENRWGSYVEKALDKLPDNGIRTAAKYGMVTQDTAAFQLLAASVQYGDFVAKAILYDHLVAKGKDEKEAVAEVGEAFINYNVLAGRNRDWLERHGLLWFYNYKLRSMKEAAYLLRNHPLRAMLMMTMPGLSSLQSAIDSNFLTLAVEGDLPWSIGPGMGLNAWTLNPVVNLTGLDNAF